MYDSTTIFKKNCRSNKQGYLREFWNLHIQKSEWVTSNGQPVGTKVLIESSLIWCQASRFQAEFVNSFSVSAKKRWRTTTNGTQRHEMWLDLKQQLSDAEVPNFYSYVSAGRCLKIVQSACLACAMFGMHLRAWQMFSSYRTPGEEQD
jgi:hypothetical protein